MIHFSVVILTVCGLVSTAIDTSVKGGKYQYGQNPQPHPSRFQQEALRQVHMIFRHGDRAPIGTYPNDPNKDYDWPFGRSQLTDVGKHQQYNLGNFLRQRYSRFLSSDPREINVRSSDKDMCLASAQANLAAFFRPSGKWVWNSQLPWQPVPIHTAPEESDWLLNEDSKCPAAEEIKNNIMRTPEGIQYAEKYKALLAKVSEYSGKQVNDPTSVLAVYGITYINKLNNLVIPSWVDPLWEEFTRAADEAFVVAYASKKLLRLRGGPLLGQITSLMKKYEKETTTESINVQPKGFIYSTNDAIMAAFLNAVGVFNGKQIPYAATIILELQENQRPINRFTVRMYYRNTTQGELYPLTIPRCQFDCPLTDFQELLQDMVPVNIQEECYGHSKAPQVSSSSSSSCCCCNQCSTSSTFPPTTGNGPLTEKYRHDQGGSRAQMQELLLQMREVLQQHKQYVDRSVQELMQEMDDVDHTVKTMRAGSRETSEKVTHSYTKKG